MTDEGRRAEYEAGIDWDHPVFRHASIDDRVLVRYVIAGGIPGSCALSWFDFGEWVGRYIDELRGFGVGLFDD